MNRPSLWHLRPRCLSLLSSRYSRSRFVTLRHRPRFFSLSSSRAASKFQYELIEFVENLDKYQPGGYHPISIDDRLHDRYRVVHKLGHGTYSTVWLAVDEKTAQYVAVKVSIADAPPGEIEALSHLTSVVAASSNSPTGASLVPTVKDHFTINGPNGTHSCLVTSPTKCSLADSKEEGGRALFQLEVARSLAAQLILAVCFIHSQGYCHGDLHLGNLLLQLPSSINSLSVEDLYTKIAAPLPQPVVRTDGKPYSINPGGPSHVILPVWLGEEDANVTLNEAKLLLSDFGTAFRPSDKSTFKSQTPLIIRPPEALFEPATPLSFGSDVWSLGCVIFELFAQGSLVNGFMATQDDIIAQQITLLGPMPENWWLQWDSKSEWFDPNGELHDESVSVGSWEQRFDEWVQDARQHFGYPTVSDEEKTELIELLKSMVNWKPAERPSAEQLLDMAWVKNQGLPAYEFGGKSSD